MQTVTVLFLFADSIFAAPIMAANRLLCSLPQVIVESYRKHFNQVHHVAYILCYNMLQGFFSLAFSLISACNALWKDITANVSLKIGQISIGSCLGGSLHG